MAKQTATDPTEYIQPLNMNGLRGRMLRLPPAAGTGKKHEILVVYGHHSTLERWWGLVQNFSEFGTVTMPDLPGFGGMDSFYKIGQKPTIDNLADYLAAFIKLRYKRRKVVIVGISFGFVVATRMLQRFPDLVKRVEFVVSAAGFAHHDDFSFSPMRKRWYRLASLALSLPVVSSAYRVIGLNPWVLRQVYSRTHNAKHKFADVANTPEKFNAMMDMEITLWHKNDVRTQFYTSWQFFHLDNCKQKVPLPVWHIHTKTDQYFNNHIVEQHFKVIFSECIDAKVVMQHHVVSVLADKKETAPFIPAKLRRWLAKQP